MKLPTLILISFLSLTYSASAQVRASAAIDTASHLIGDWIPVKIEVVHPPDVIVFPPDPGEKAGKLEVLRITGSEPGRVGEEVVENYFLTVAAYDTGRFTLPPLRINYHQRGDTIISSVETDSLVITVISAGGDTLTGIHDIKPPAKLRWEFADYLPYIIIIAIAAVIALVYWWWKRRKRLDMAAEEETSLELRIDPYERAMKRLTEMEARAVWKKGFVKEYYSEATEIVREYIEGDFRIPALEMTSEELIDAARTRGIMDVDQAMEYFGSADLVKFAKFIPDAEMCDSLADQTYSILKDAHTRAPKDIAADIVEGETRREETAEMIIAEISGGGAR